jgi:hypothetical protein
MESVRTSHIPAELAAYDLNIDIAERPMFEHQDEPSVTVAARGVRGLAARLARSLWPFWLFKDVNRGDVYARAAARQHNRLMRESLPRYLLKWAIVCGVANLSIFAFEALAADVGRHLDVFVLMAAGSGLVCACAVCVLCVIGYAYLCLSRSER